MPGPFWNGATGHIARPDRHIEAVVEGRDDGTQGTRVVGEVGVHLHEGVVTPFEAPGESSPIGAPQSGFGRPGQEVYVGPLGGHGPDQIARPVGTAIVDHQESGSG